MDEFLLFRELQPHAVTVPVLSTGGAVLELSTRTDAGLSEDLSKDFDYVSLFHRHLNIDKRELRFAMLIAWLEEQAGLLEAQGTAAVHLTYMRGHHGCASNGKARTFPRRSQTSPKTAAPARPGPPNEKPKPEGPGLG